MLIGLLAKLECRIMNTRIGIAGARDKGQMLLRSEAPILLSVRTISKTHGRGIKNE
jgi:hypothetical protein